MQRGIYSIGFGLVALSVAGAAILSVSAMLGVHFRFIPLFSLLEMFSHPVPALFRRFLPAVVNTIFFWAFVALVARRIWLLISRRSVFPPSSFTRIPHVLTCIAIASVALLVLGLALSIAIKAGSGVPAGLLAIPAVLFLPPVVAWVEARSLSTWRTEA
jgi:hypothetical protein